MVAMRFTFISLWLLLGPWLLMAGPLHQSELIFPLENWHNHGSCIVEAPNGDLLVCWFHGSGERQADDVQILGARHSKSTGRWSEPFVMADTPEFPDINCCMIIDPEQRLWLFWPVIQANLWESALMEYKVSTDYQWPGQPPVWGVEKVLRCTCSYFKRDEAEPSREAKSIKHATFNLEWVMGEDAR
jgi:hypothetical protein